MEAAGFTKNRAIEALTRSTHGDLAAYAPMAREAVLADPEFFARLIAWNEQRGAVRDSKIALPILSLREPTYDAVLAENSYAHLAVQDPRQLVKALDFARKVGVPGHSRRLRGLVERYLRHREQNFGLWERAAIQHRRSLKTLYSRWHIKPGNHMIQQSLYGQVASRKIKGGQPTPAFAPVGSTLDIISQLPKMSPKEALGHVLRRKIPFLIVRGALGGKLSDPDTVLAVINSMSHAELINHAKDLDKLGVKTNPALRAAFRDRLEKAGAEAKPQGLLKASRAAADAEAHGNVALAKTLRQTQEKQLQAHGGVKGRWLILGDKSGSMELSIEASRFVAGHLAKLAEQAFLCFFDTNPYWKEVTGWTLEQIEEATRLVRSGGGTAIGIGLAYAYERGHVVDGIAIVSDGEDSSGSFPAMYKAYCAKMQIEPTVYFFKVPGGRDILSHQLEAAGLADGIFDLTQGPPVDYYSIQNLISTLNTKRWTLLDQIMDTPLLTLEGVFG